MLFGEHALRQCEMFLTTNGVLAQRYLTVWTSPYEAFPVGEPVKSADVRRNWQDGGPHSSLSIGDLPFCKAVRDKCVLRALLFRNSVNHH